MFEDMDDEKKNALFTTADRVHRVTRERVIERSLLFAVGDEYDPDLIRETERNLRALPYLRKVEISGIDTSSGAVVVVRTWDAWTLELNGRFGRAGGVTQLAAGVSDRNVLGTGKSVGVLYSQSPSDVDRTAEYNDPQFLGRPFTVFNLKGGESSSARHYEALIGRPFYATISKLSLTGGGKYVEDQQGVYDDYSYAGTVGRRHYEGNVTFGYALVATPRRTRRLTVAVVQRQDDYSARPGERALFVPRKERQTALELGLDSQDIRFIKQKRIQRLSRAEDFNMGLSVFPSVSYAPAWAALGATGESITPRLDARKGWVSELGHFLFLRTTYASTYVNGGNGSRLASVDSVYLCRYYPRHTVAAHVRLDHGWRLAAPALLGLGEDSGLRGYRSTQYRGDRRLLVNAEDRIFLVENLWRLLDAGGVLFVDSGYAWMPGQSLRLRDMKSSVGFGLRLAATRSAANVPVRIDVARALNDNDFPSRWTVSIQASQAFGPE